MNKFVSVTPMSIILTLKLTKAHQCVFLFLQRCGYSDSQTLIKSLNSLQAQLGILGFYLYQGEARLRQRSIMDSSVSEVQPSAQS